ncbi:MAG: NAD-dependent epimerase/dehydratase family protein [Chloroflexi bacterium]|nr:NAD-dependent epimerase/dehydratase family protein [Chloroflexota bacterium]
MISQVDAAFPVQEFIGRSILVTGAMGFVGRHLIDALKGVGVANLVLTDIYPQKSLESMGGKYVTMDLNDRECVLQFGRDHRFEYVFHLAGKIDQTIRPGVYQEQLHIHVDATLNLLDAVSMNDLRNFVYVGSNAEYGNAPCPHSEMVHETPNSAYGVSKLAASRLVLAKVASEGIPAVVVRPFLIYGPGQSQHSFLQMALDAAFAGRDFPTTAGEQTRDWVSVDKVVQDLLNITAKSYGLGRIFNSCTGVEIKLKEVLMLIKQYYPTFKPLIGEIPYRRNELMRSVGLPFVGLSKEQAIQKLSDFIAGD